MNSVEKDSSTFDILLELDDQFFELPTMIGMAQWVLWLLDHKALRKGEMRNHDYSNAGNPDFLGFRKRIGHLRKGRHFPK